MSGQVAGLCQDTSSLRGLKRIGVAVTRSGGSGFTVGMDKNQTNKQKSYYVTLILKVHSIETATQTAKQQQKKKTVV